MNNHPDYQQYDESFTGFLDKPKSVFTPRKQKNKYLGKIFYACNMSYQLEDLPQNICHTSIWSKQFLDCRAILKPILPTKVYVLVL
jgi:hypothetical protein